MCLIQEPLDYCFSLEPQTSVLTKFFKSRVIRCKDIDYTSPDQCSDYSSDIEEPFLSGIEDRITNSSWKECVIREYD